MAHIKNEAITARNEDFAKWYTEVCKKAELMDYTSMKGFIIYRPYGYAIWESIRNYLDKKFKETGHENVYLPMVIKESLFNKEKEHVEGFAPETLIVTIGGKDKLDDPLIIRPTSEVLFCEHYSKIISSYRDLPKLYNQWCSVVRYEKTTRPFLRGSEFLWQEGHTVHATAEEAKEEAIRMLHIYDDLGKNFLAIPFLKGRKTEKEKFAGAKETYAIEALMHDGQSLQAGTTHYFGDNFSKAFDISFQDKDGSLKHPYQSSWGVSTRLIGALIMVHGDDNGLVLPPRVAPTQVVIVPIRYDLDEKVKKVSDEIYEQLKSLGIRVKLDNDSSRSPGWKYAEYEMKGIPLRLEIGPRDLANNELVMALRYNGEKKTIKLDEIDKIPSILDEIHEAMYQKAKAFLDDHIHVAHNKEELGELLKQGGYVETGYCEDEACEKKVKELYQATARVIPFDVIKEGTCPICGKKTKKVVLYARAY